MILKVIPLERAGIYVPGGTAAYPSTVLMDSIPALTAGCKEIIMTTPPNADGSIAPAVIAAAVIAQETVPGAGSVRIFRTGGAQAVAALAYGTESIPAVDKIVGPGNAYVAAAKKLVDEKMQDIELCSWFTKEKTQEVIDAIGGAVAVGSCGL